MASENDTVARWLSGLTLLATVIGWFVVYHFQTNLAHEAKATTKELEKQKQDWAEDQEFRKQLRDEIAAKPKLVIVDKGRWEPGDAYHLLIRSASTKPVRIISATYKYTWNGPRPAGERGMGAKPDNIYVEFKQWPKKGEPPIFKTVVDQVVMPMNAEATVIVGIVIPAWAGKESFDGTLTLNYGDQHDPLQLVVEGVRIDAMTKLDRNRGQ